MGLLNFISSWFKDKESADKKSIQAENNTLIINNQISAIRSWVEKELPPLAWDRIVLRMTKHFILNYEKTLNDFDPNSALPEEAKVKVETCIFELYKKKIQIVNK